MKKINNEDGSILLSIVVIGFIVASMAMVTVLSTRNSTDRISGRRRIVSVFNIAEAGKEHALAELRNGTVIPESGTDISIFTSESFEGGSYSVEYDGNEDVDTLWISSEGTYDDKSATVDVLCAVNPVYSDITVTIEAAVTTLSDITSSGNITIDGRDWNSSGTSVVGPGLLGIKTCGSLTQTGSSELGGNGHAPAHPAVAGSIEHLCSPAGYPTTPEEVLGLPAGALDKYKSGTLPTMPFNGIVYYTPSGSFNCPKLKGSYGIFIVHNDDLTASIKNIDGDFTGILIADRVDHINSGSDIIGGVVTLSPVAGTNAFGNGNANIKYSSEVIIDLMNSYTVATDTTFDVVSWRQVQ